MLQVRADSSYPQKESMSKKKAPVKRGRGHPTDYRPEYCQQLVAFIKRGGPMVKKPTVVSDGAQQGSRIIDHPLGKLPGRFEAFATKLDVTMETLSEWCRVHPKFSESYKKAKHIQLQQLLTGLQAGIYSTAGAIFELKNNHGWRDRDDSQDPKQLISFIVMQINTLLPNPEERLKFVEQWEKKLLPAEDASKDNQPIA